MSKHSIQLHMCFKTKQSTNLIFITAYTLFSTAIINNILYTFRGGYFQHVANPIFCTNTPFE